MILQLAGRLGNVLFNISYGMSLKEMVYYKINNPMYYIMLFNIKKYFHNIRLPLYTGSHKGLLNIKLSEKTFDVNIVRENIKFKNNLNITRIEDNSVGIHIRRGDYVSLDSIWRYLGSKYYEDMYCKYFNGKIAYIATDDVLWCKENIHIPNVIYIDEFTKNEFETLYCLSRCKHHIGSCSTFSWWGTWINEQPDAINIYPSLWFNLDKRPLSKEEIYIQKNIIPDRWIKVDY